MTQPSNMLQALVIDLRSKVQRITSLRAFPNRNLPPSSPQRILPAASADSPVVRTAQDEVVLMYWLK